MHAGYIHYVLYMLLENKLQDASSVIIPTNSSFWSCHPYLLILLLVAFSYSYSTGPGIYGSKPTRVRGRSQRTRAVYVAINPWHNITQYWCKHKILGMMVWWLVWSKQWIWLVRMIARGREIWIIFSLVPLWEGKYPTYTPVDIVLKHT